MIISLLSVMTVAVLVIAGTVCAVTGLRRRRTHAALARLAHRNRMNYHPSDDLDLSGRLAGLEWMQRGYHRTIFDILHGSSPAGALYCFRYRYDRGFGSQRQTHRWAAAILQLDGIGAGVLREPRRAPAGAEWDEQGNLISLRRPDDGSSDQLEWLVQAMAQYSAPHGEPRREVGVAISA